MEKEKHRASPAPAEELWVFRMARRCLLRMVAQPVADIVGLRAARLQFEGF
jgi:hypothetical protein